MQDKLGAAFVAHCGPNEKAASDGGLRESSPQNERRLGFASTVIAATWTQKPATERIGLQKAVLGSDVDSPAGTNLDPLR